MALTSPDESDAVGGGVVRRNRVALAMEHVAKYIPITDQRSFLKDEHDDDDDHADHDNYQCDDDKNKNKNKLMHNDIKNGIEHENRDRAQERKMKRQWLTVQDFCNSNSDSSSSTGTCTGTSQLLDQVLDRGRLLLSCQESTFDVCNSTGDGDLQNEYDREMSMLSKLDASVSTSTSGPPDEKSRARGSSTRTSTSMQKFMNERVDLQRNILAKRLGLGGILSSSMVTGTGLLNDMVSNEDLVDLPPVTGTGTVTVTPSSTKTRDDNNDNNDQDKKRSAREINLERMKKRQKLERDKNENDKDDENKEDGQDSTIRRILLLSMDHDRASHTRARSRTRTSRINSNSTRLISHKTPQTILATDLIFHSFHPSWHIRHGSLLGLLALLRAWRISYSLQTIMKKVMIMLILCCKKLSMKSIDVVLFVLSSDEEESENESSLLEIEDQQFQDEMVSSDEKIENDSTSPVHLDAIQQTSGNKRKRRGPKQSFDKHFNDLMAFKAKYGHCDVSQHGEDASLGQWCSERRGSYKKMQKNQKPRTKLSEEQIQRLSDAGFKWCTLTCLLR